MARREVHDALARATAAQAPKPAANAGKVLAWAIGSMLVFGMCVAGMIEDSSPSPSPPPPVVLPTIEPIPIPPPTFEPPPELLFPAETSFIGVHHHTGTITGPANLAGFKLGDRCDVWISPNPDANNCRWAIDCGEPRKRIYGGGDVGYSDCTIMDGHPTSAGDDEQDAPDGSFMASLTGSDPMVLVEDRWLLPPTRVLISIDQGGGRYEGSVPDVKLARRKQGDAIQAAIDRDELPEIKDEAAEMPEKLSANQVRKILESRKDELLACGVGEWAVKLEIELLSEGRVESVRVTPTLQEELELCLVETVVGTRFPAFSGPHMNFTWTLRL